MRRNKVARLVNHFYLAFLFGRLAGFNSSERIYFREDVILKTEI